ncbi:MAG: hypothetical protein HUK20_02720 [Fibrobacter sp.]|nr:hypothetical protein [Fibrobacter sp.]
MKTKIASFLTITVASLLALATNSFAEAEAGFYEKEHVHGFISIGGDYRGMFDYFHKYVNTVAFMNGGHLVDSEGSADETEASSESNIYSGSLGKYSTFDNYFIGLHVNIGAQYKQFLTWFDINFMPPQTSERPRSKYVASNPESQESYEFPLYDIGWYAYGADWMFGWKLLGEDSPINVIPAVGFGINLINFHLGSNFTIIDLEDPNNSTNLRDRYYSTMAATVNTELEVRLELGRIAVGLYGGYRYVRYNDLQAEGFNILDSTYSYDNNGDTWFVGLRLTWIFKSQWEEKQENKL